MAKISDRRRTQWAHRASQPSEPSCCSVIEDIRSKGVHRSREVNRAHVLSCLDRGVPEAQIMAVLGIGRTAV
jgi:hypothetical protein